MLEEQIRNYMPFNEQEEKDKEVMLKYLDMEDIFTRENQLAHFTASNWIVNSKMTKVLMVYHNIYKSWAWTGGHADGDKDLLHVALKEAREETGIKKLKVLSNGIYGLQVLTVEPHIKRGQYISAHLHLDCCFLLQADEDEELRIKEDENSGVKWVNIDEVVSLTNESQMVPIYSKLNIKLKSKI